VLCKNPALAQDRARKREELLLGAERELGRVVEPAVPAGSRVRKRSGCACARSSAAKVGKRPCLTICSAAVVSFALLWSTAQGPRCLYALLTPIDLAQPVMLPGNRECEPERESDSLLIESRHRPP